VIPFGCGRAISGGAGIGNFEVGLSAFAGLYHHSRNLKATTAPSKPHFVYSVNNEPAREISDRINIIKRVKRDAFATKHKQTNKQTRMYEMGAGTNTTEMDLHSGGVHIRLYSVFAN
jgi:hypothetical protein